MSKNNLKQAEFGARLRQLLDTLDYSPEELAEKIHCSRQSVYNWLNTGTLPKRTYRRALAETLRVDIAWLIYGTEVAESQSNENLGSYGQTKRVEKCNKKFAVTVHSPTTSRDSSPMESLLEDAREILLSESSYAHALCSNIRAFKKALDTEDRLVDIDQRLRQLEDRKPHRKNPFNGSGVGGGM